MKIWKLIVPALLVGCTGKSYDCANANVDCTGGGTNDAEPATPQEPSSSNPSSPDVSPSEGSWYLEDPEFTQDNCQLDSEENDSGDEAGTVAELSKEGSGAYRLSIDPDQGVEFSCNLSGSELGCDLLTIQQDFSPTLGLVQEFSLSAVFASETQMAASILLSYDCVGEDCEQFLEEADVVIPCQSIGSFDAYFLE